MQQISSLGSAGGLAPGRTLSVFETSDALTVRRSWGSRRGSLDRCIFSGALEELSVAVVVMMWSCLRGGPPGPAWRWHTSQSSLRWWVRRRSWHTFWKEKGGIHDRFWARNACWPCSLPWSCHGGGGRLSVVVEISCWTLAAIAAIARQQRRGDRGGGRVARGAASRTAQRAP
jgi:hypothetical protein